MPDSRLFGTLIRTGKEMESTKEKYRHELKYMVDEREAELAVARIRQFMKTDEYHPEGKYRIRSVYFDDIWNSALMQNMNGVSPRSKYRIRVYNEEKGNIRLEQKIKNHDMTKKRSCLLSLDECNGLLQGCTEGIGAEEGGEGRGLLLDLGRKMHWDYLRPKVIVEYERTAFTYKEGNVRVTFDRNLAASNYVCKLWDNKLPKNPVMGNGKCVMEVKFDEFLPGCVKQALDTGKMERIRFSKYTLCRMKGTMEKWA